MSTVFGRHRPVTLAMLATLVLVAAGGYWWFGPAARGVYSGFLRSADQAGQRLYDRGEMAAAAARFVDPAWLGVATFRAGDFERAAGIFSGLDDASAHYNRGNALVMLGRYDDAVQAYDAALSLRANWKEAAENREIAVHRAERVKAQGGEMTDGKLAADEIRFDQQGSDEPAAEAEVAGGPDDAELREIWLRRVRTDPADFLKAKFAYQRATAGNDGEHRADGGARVGDGGAAGSVDSDDRRASR